MKTGIFSVVAVSLLQLAAAQPHRNHHQHIHQKRDVVTVIDYVTAAAPDVVVYVDSNGVPVSTSYANQATATPASSSTASSSVASSTAPVAYTPHAHKSRSSTSRSSTSSTPPASTPPAYTLPASTSSTPPASTSSTPPAYTPAPVSSSVVQSSTPAPVQSSAPAPVPSSSTPAPVQPSSTAPAPVQSSAAPAPVQSSTAPAPVQSSAAPAPVTSSAAPVASPSAAPGGGSSGLGMVYSPYSNNGNCKSASQIMSDFQKINGYGMVRIYGTDCNQVSNVLAAAKSKGMKLWAGVYDITQTESAVSTIIAAAAGDWSSFHTVSVGNELINNGGATVSALITAIECARTNLKAAGYTGNVVTVDTVPAWTNPANAALCDHSDFVAANAHSFFARDWTTGDGLVAPADTGSWAVGQAQKVSKACNGKTAWITESGWPTAGECKGLAVPSVENQAAAISSLKANFSNNLILFTAFDDMWKSATAPNTFGAEQFWGVYGAA